MIKKKILFLPSNKNHVDLFFPLYQKLKKKYKIIFVTQGSFKTEGAERTLNKFKIKFKNFEHYKEQNPEYILKSEGIDLIILGNDIDVIPQWFINCANPIKIPSILIQDGMLFNYTTNLKLFSKIPKILMNSKKLITLSIKLKIKKKYKTITYGKSDCTQIHVWGKFAEVYLKEKNIDPKKIIITGNPKFQHTYKLNSKPQKIKLILYCPTSLIETGILEKKKVFDLVQTLCEVISPIKNVRLIIKPHPIEKKIFYEKLIHQFGGKISITSKNVDELIGISNCVITNLSTVSIEAIANSKPVLLYLPYLTKITENNSFPQILIDKGVALSAYDKKSLNRQLTKILDNKFIIKEIYRKEILKELYGPLDSNAVQRSISQIKNLLK